MRPVPGAGGRGGVRGLSLVELLVALLLGVVLSFAAMQFYLQSRRNALYDEELARLQENGRYALRLLVHELGMAGYLATLPPGEPVTSALAGSGCFDHLLAAKAPVELLDDVDRGGAGAGHALPADCLPGRHVPGSDVLLTRRSADSPSIAEGERRLSLDSRSLYLGWAATSHPTLVRGAGAGAFTELWEYLPQLLFLRDYSVVPGDDIPTLCRRRPGRSANRMAPTECLVEGIENLQLEFGIDADADGQVERFLSAGSPVALRPARLARIHLLVRSLHPVAGHVDRRAHRLGNTLLAPRRDAYLRIVLQTTVLLRNSGILRL